MASAWDPALPGVGRGGDAARVQQLRRGAPSAHDGGAAGGRLAGLCCLLCRRSEGAAAIAASRGEGSAAATARAAHGRAVAAPRQVWPRSGRRLRHWS
eukprot:1401725-Prymnesium_polylepis.1